MSSLMNYGIIASFLASITWSVGVSGYSALSRRYPPSAVNFSRALVALPIFILLTLFTVGPGAYRAITWHHFGWLSLSMVSSYALGDLLLLMAVVRIGLPSALAIASSYPIWSALAGWIFKGEVLGPLQLLGLLLIVLGSIFVILGNRQPAGSSTRRDSFGYFLSLGTSLLWSLNVISVSNGGSGLAATATSSVRMAIALILCPAIGYLLNKSTKVLISKEDFKKSSWIFLVEGVGGGFFFTYGMTHAPLAIGSALSSLSPVITVPIAFVMGWEKPSLLRTAGVILVVVGGWLLI